MELRDIMELWDRFEKSSAAEMELDFQGTHFSLKKSGRPQMTQVIETNLPAAEEAAVLPAAEGKAALTENKAPKEIKAPLVGTFYAAPSPDADPFVKVGDQVKKGDVIGIIEAMKLMNEVTAKEDGIVEEIVAANGDLVSFQQVLMRLR